MYHSWNTYRDYLENKYGTSLYRVGVDGGFSCPNRTRERQGGCTFCDGTGSVAVYQRSSESAFRHDSEYEENVAKEILLRFRSIEDQIRKGLEFIKRRYKADEAALYFQSWTNTYDSVENLKAIYDRALSLHPWRELIVSTRPDCIADDVCALLSGYVTENRDVWVELGLQSANDRTLREINRGHTVEDFFSASRRARSYGLKVCTHVILGLPGETDVDYVRSAEAVNDSGSEAVKIHNLHIAGGTRMAESYLDGEVVTGSGERHLENTELFLRHLRPDVVVERMVCETPSHRLIAPRFFPDKSLFLRTLDRRMMENGTRQGDCFEG